MTAVGHLPILLDISWGRDWVPIELNFVFVGYLLKNAARFFHQLRLFAV